MRYQPYTVTLKNGHKIEVVASNNMEARILARKRITNTHLEIDSVTRDSGRRREVVRSIDPKAFLRL
jgi:hypothetical protein